MKIISQFSILSLLLKNRSIAFDISKIEPILKKNVSKMNKVMTTEPSFFNSSPTLKQLRSQSIKSIEVKPSSIANAGLGLFAKKNIKANTIISFYPAHTLGMEIDNDKQLWVYNDDINTNYFKEHPSSSSSYIHATDQPIFNRDSILGISKQDVLYLDCNPTIEHDALWVSQYINDGAIIASNDEQGVKEYYTNSKRLKNCIHIPFGPSPIMATVTTKKVKKGEELFTSYGAVYWLGVLYSNQEGVDLTSHIQGQINESAKDLFVSMKNVGLAYGNEIDALIHAYNEI